MKKVKLAGIFAIIITGFFFCKPPAVTTKSKNMDNTIQGKNWKLTELNGQPILHENLSAKEPHIIFSATDTTVSGNGGCNGFGGNYALQEPNRIAITRVISTMMACDQLDVENQFFKVLQMADNYYLIGDTLILNKARMAPLARFIAEPIK